MRIRHPTILLDTNVFCEILKSNETRDRFAQQFEKIGGTLFVSEPTITESMEGYKNDKNQNIKNRFRNLSLLMNRFGPDRIKITHAMIDTFKIEMRRNGTLKAPSCYARSRQQDFEKYFARDVDFLEKIEELAGEMLAKAKTVKDEFATHEKSFRKSFAGESNKTEIVEYLNQYSGLIPPRYLRETSAPILWNQGLVVSLSKLARMLRETKRYAFTRFFLNGLHLYHVIVSIPTVDAGDPLHFRIERGNIADLNVAAYGTLADIFITNDERLTSFLEMMKSRIGYRAEVITLEGFYKRS